MRCEFILRGVEVPIKIVMFILSLYVYTLFSLCLSFFIAFWQIALEHGQSH